MEKNKESEDNSFQDIDSDNNDDDEDKNYNLNNNLIKNQIIYEKVDLEKNLVIKDINDNKFENIFDNNEKKNESINENLKKEPEPKLKGNAFLELIDSVRFYIIKFLDWKRHTKKIIYRSILFWCTKSSFNTIRF